MQPDVDKHPVIKPTSEQVEQTEREGAAALAGGLIGFTVGLGIGVLFALIF